MTQLLPLVDAIPPIRGQRGAPRCRPERILGDRAYDSQPLGRRWLSAASKAGWPGGGFRTGPAWASCAGWVERTIAWLHQFRRLRVRYEKLAEIYQAFLSIGCRLICHRKLKKFFVRDF